MAEAGLHSELALRSESAPRDAPLAEAAAEAVFWTVIKAPGPSPECVRALAAALQSRQYGELHAVHCLGALTALLAGRPEELPQTQDWELETATRACLATLTRPLARLPSVRLACVIFLAVTSLQCGAHCAARLGAGQLVQQMLEVHSLRPSKEDDEWRYHASKFLELF
jgi:hypothetical protein